MFLSQLLCVTDSLPTCSDYLLLSLLRAVVAILDSFHFSLVRLLERKVKLLEKLVESLLR